MEDASFSSPASLDIPLHVSGFLIQKSDTDHPILLHPPPPLDKGRAKEGFIF